MLYSPVTVEKGVAKPLESPPLLLDTLTEYSYHALCSFYFWILLVIVTLIEPILCASYPTGSILHGQIAILVIGSVLFAIQLLGELHVTWSKIPTSPSTLLELWHIVYYFIGRGEYIIEGGGLMIGWIFLFKRPGLAILRCFRVFRLLWLYRINVFRATLTRYLDPIVGAIFIERSFQVCAFAIRSLSALGSEMFRLTKHTRGGLLLMLILFYNAFVFGAVLWVETGHSNSSSSSTNSTSYVAYENSTSFTSIEAVNGTCSSTTYLYANNICYSSAEDSSGSSPCDTMPSCMYLMLRLTFFDGNGLDFVYTLTNKHPFLFFLVMVYMCITAFGIINGLVGIFGTAFTRASDESFQEIDETALRKKVELMLGQIQHGSHDDGDAVKEEVIESRRTEKAETREAFGNVIDKSIHNQESDEIDLLKDLPLDLEHGRKNVNGKPPRDKNQRNDPFSKSNSFQLHRGTNEEVILNKQKVAQLRRQRGQHFRALSIDEDSRTTFRHHPTGLFASSSSFYSQTGTDYDPMDWYALVYEMRQEIKDLRSLLQSHQELLLNRQLKRSNPSIISRNVMRRVSNFFTSRRSFGNRNGRLSSPGTQKRSNIAKTVLRVDSPTTLFDITVQDDASSKMNDKSYLTQSNNEINSKDVDK